MPKTLTYQQQLDLILEGLSQTAAAAPDNRKPSLLLHACCAPCSSYVIEYLSAYFDITIYYYNPNIYPEAEYSRRLNELKKFLPEFCKANGRAVKLIEASYNPEEFFDATNVNQEPELKAEPERGERCRRCYEFRMKKAYEYAVRNDFDWFTTTLSISPFKDVDKINVIGKQLETCGKTKFLTSDFKKKNGFKRSLELSKEYGLYRQDYCGCVFSKESNLLK